MIPDGDGKPESTKPSADEMAKLLEIELAQKRAAWQNASARNKNVRAMGFMFLFIVVIGALFAFYYVVTQVNERRANGTQPTATATP